MNPIEILTKWAEYIEYDPEQKQFNLLSSEYAMHKCGKNIETLSKEYDPSGTLAVIYARNTFLDYLKQVKVSLFDVMNKPESFIETQAMWNLFGSVEVQNIEDNYLQSLDSLVKQVIGRRLIGEGNLDDIRKPFCNSVDIIVENLAKCQEDVFLKGGAIKELKFFSSHIHVFNSLAECLVALEGARDGMYLCYIRMNDTADGYFGYYLKSNGNIVSINERVNEAYAGQHKNSRNGRWSEDKQYNLFPYNFIFSFGDYDYKGYSSKHIIDDEKLSFFNLGPDAYFPILLAMAMLSQKYTGKTLDAPIKYVDSLLPININRLSSAETALIIPEHSLVATGHKSLTIQFNDEGVLTGEYQKKFNWQNNEDAHYTETGSYTESGQEFVDMYGQGFHYDADKLLVANPHIRQIVSKNADKQELNAEFVGTQRRMEMEAYRNIREQLAEYIRDRMYEEYTAFGGAKGVRDWWNNTIQEQMTHIKKICVDKLLALYAGTTPNVGDGWTSGEPEMLAAVSYERDTKWPKGYGNTILNDRVLDTKWSYGDRKAYKYECLDMENGNICTQFFIFKPRNHEEIEAMLGAEVPKIIKGWQLDGHFGVGNSILHSTDKVSEVGTPFESREYQRNKRYSPPEKDRYHDDSDPRMNFAFAIGFSKRTLNRMLKEAGYSGTCTDTIPKRKA